VYVDLEVPVVLWRAVCCTVRFVCTRSVFQALSSLRLVASLHGE
jgi:hypothetical protein